MFWKYDLDAPFMSDKSLSKNDIKVLLVLAAHARDKKECWPSRATISKHIENGDKVKITLRFRGREMAHQTLGATVLDRVQDETEELCKVETLPKLEGRQMVMILAPK